MKRLAAAAFAIAIALPACAQRGGHAGFAAGRASASRSAPVFRGGFASPRPSFAPAPLRYASGPLAPRLSFPVAAPPARPSFYHRGAPIAGTHRFFRSYPVIAYPYSSYVVGYLPSDLLDNSFDNYDAYQQPQPQPDQAYYPQQPAPPEYGYAQPEPRPEYSYPQPAPEHGYSQPAPQPSPAIPSGTQPAPADTVTLIFKDGRPPQQIQNYLATNTTLTVIDGNRHHDIPIAELDVPATIKANRDTGVGFQLPTATP